MDARARQGVRAGTNHSAAGAHLTDDLRLGEHAPSGATSWAADGIRFAWWRQDAPPWCLLRHCIHYRRRTKRDIGVGTARCAAFGVSSGPNASHTEAHHVPWQRAWQVASHAPLHSPEHAPTHSPRIPCRAVPLHAPEQRPSQRPEHCLGKAGELARITAGDDFSGSIRRYKRSAGRTGLRIDLTLRRRSERADGNSPTEKGIELAEHCSSARITTGFVSWLKLRGHADVDGHADKPRPPVFDLKRDPGQVLGRLHERPNLGVRARVGSVLRGESVGAAAELRARHGVEGPESAPVPAAIRKYAEQWEKERRQGQWFVVQDKSLSENAGSRQLSAAFRCFVVLRPRR